MFAYCGNDPISKKDSSGQWSANALLSTPSAIVCVAALSDGGSALPISEIGAASPYIPSKSRDFNCYAYVLGEEHWKNVGGSSNAIDDYDVDKVAEMVLADAQRDGRKIRIIDSYDSPIESYEYRIALRTGVNDYHFMMQHCDGTWSHKPGFCKTRLIYDANPSVASWDAPKISELWALLGVIKETDFEPNYYDSKTIYFAVSVVN